MEFSKRREAKRSSSCNFDTIIIDDDELLRRGKRSTNDRSQIRRRCNRFYFFCNYWSHAASASMLLLMVAALMLPCSSARALVHPTTTWSPLDNDNRAELTTDATQSSVPLTQSHLANTTTNQSTIGKAHDLSKQEENNEIFAVLEISPDAVKPKFELSETSLSGDLEETIRNSVKTEIEMEQNLGSAAILDVLKDIPETEVRQKIAEEILSIDYPQKNTKEHRFNVMAKESVAEKQHKTTVSSTATNNFIEQTRDVEKNIFNAGLSTDVSLEKIVESTSIHNVEENIREARNLNTVIEEHLNILADIENPNIDNIEENTEIVSSTPKVIELTNMEKTFDLEIDPSSSSSDSSSASSESNSIEFSAKLEVDITDDNTLDTVENEINTEITENQLDLTTSKSTSAEAIVVKIPEAFDSNLDSVNNNNSLSIVLDETLSATEPSVLLDNDKLQNFIDFEATNDISNVDEVTIAPVQIFHIVIKKQGVDLNAAPLDTIGNGGLGIFTETTVSSVIEKVTDMYSGNTEPPIDIATYKPVVDKNDTIDLLEQTIDLKQFSTVQPEVVKYVHIETEVPSVDIDIVDSSVEENGSGDVEEQEFEQKSQSQLDAKTELPSISVQTVAPVTDENDLGDLGSQEFTSTEVNKQFDFEPLVPLVKETEIIAFTTVAPEQQSQTNIHVASTAFDEDNDFIITLKGSRSVHMNDNPLSNVDETAATLFETFPPRDAGQTFNDNLAAESSGGKALPTISFNNDPTNRSGVIIVICSSTAILFIVILVVIFLISFQRQHGTLDIEMQEQRCGKDNLDEEDAETCIKLLSVELPPATIIVDAEETDECL